MEQQGCEIAVIAPHEASMHCQIGAEGDIHARCYGLLVNAWIDDCRYAFEEAASRLPLPIKIRRFPLQKEPVPNHKTWRHIRESEVLVTVDPSDDLIDFIVQKGIRKHPMMRLVLGMTTVESRDRHFNLLGTLKTEVLQRTDEGIATRIVPRVCTVPVANPNDDALLTKAANFALRFPFVNLSPRPI